MGRRGSNCLAQADGPVRVRRLGQAVGPRERQSRHDGSSTPIARLVHPARHREKFFSLGKTNIFGEYRHDDAGSNPGKTVGASINFWQAGIIQNIEAADTSLYVVYQHADGDISGNAVTAAASAAPTGKTSLDSFQEVITGAKINF